ncbi:Clp amino terminal domain-containing protein, pathogenicity island component [Blastococcus aggregatus]|uniref:Clp amino terminal domain-containing protein, pathogenicity island component n=1 Tax=Blastococcus aggregatus TaxID=38502 RepID=A0A285VHN3_9ACTN|nr:Clp protease N-terminal domain-containing protein [Blastococcus aggregatus]SOC52696.1 Clp amino terminal domain-containing protein, pathogenicity island component [Blastococcus aggregatus]
MFERFTPEARQVVEGAQQQARELRSDRVGTEHLLLALLTRQGTTASTALGRHGLTREAVAADIVRLTGGEELDAAALTSLGIDLDAVRSSVEASFGVGALDGPGARSARTGHIPFTPGAKKVLELSLREAIAGKSRSITDGHVLLGLIREGQGLASTVLHDRGVDLPALREDVRLASKP